MSEYASSKSHATPKAELGPVLFDETTFLDSEDTNELDKEIAHRVDTRGYSYADAKLSLGIETPPLPELPVEAIEHRLPDEGVSINLGARAIALNTIMTAYNQLNKTRGVREHVENWDGPTDFETRYDRPMKTLSLMDKSGATKKGKANEAIQFLASSDRLVKEGFDKNEIDGLGEAVSHSLNKQFGPGNAYKSDRDKMLRKAYRAGGMKYRR